MLRYSFYSLQQLQFESRQAGGFIMVMISFHLFNKIFFLQLQIPEVDA